MYDGWRVKLCDPSLTRAVPGELLSVRLYINALFAYLKKLSEHNYLHGRIGQAYKI